MPDPDVHRLRFQLEHNPTLPEPFDAWLGVRIDDHGETFFKPLVRPDISVPAEQAVLRWVLTRIARELVPDGSDPDQWIIYPDGVRGAWHVPGDLPQWT